MAVSEELLRSLQSRIHGIPVQQLLLQDPSEPALKDLCGLVANRRQGPPPGFGFLLPPEITRRFTGDDGAWMSIRRFCQQHFADDLIAPAYLLDCLLRLYDGHAAGAWVGPDVTRRREPMLQYDSDGLLIGPKGRISFRKEGVLTDHHWILYRNELPGVGLSGGFIEALISFEARSTSTRYFGLAIKPDCIVERSLHYDSVTLAYIRGPIGLSEELLHDPGFPESPSGTVTVHQRVGDDPLHELFPLLRTEVMWSKRNGLKTVQIEELTPVTTSRMQTTGSSSNRYLHAIWDQSVGSFVHLDGAVRTYERSAFAERLRTDLRSYREKSCAYHKLFRIDASMSVGDWSDLTGRFFQNNELVLEYLGGPRGAVG